MTLKCLASISSIRNYTLLVYGAGVQRQNLKTFKRWVPMNFTKYKKYCYGTKKLLSMGIEILGLENMMKGNPVQDR